MNRLALCLALVGLGGPGFAAAPPATPRGAAVGYFADLNRAYHTRTRGFKCVTGERLHEGRIGLAWVLRAPTAVQAAWVDLALEEWRAGEPESYRTRARLWAPVAFDIACDDFTRTGRIDPRFLTLLNRVKPRLLAVFRDDVRRGAVSHGPLLAELGWWEAVPGLLELARANAAKGRVGAESICLIRLTLHHSRGKDGIEWTRLADADARAWVDAWQEWWKENRARTPAQRLLASARARQIPAGGDVRDGPGHMVQRLGEGERHLATADLLDLLRSAWPRFTTNDDLEAQQPTDRRIQQEFDYVRDAAFLLAYRRAPARALDVLHAGLKANERVRGQRILGSEPHEKLYKPTLFAPLLDDRLRADLDARVKDRTLAVDLRFRWLVFRDQLFPPAAPAWKYTAVAPARAWEAHAKERTWYVDRQRPGTTASTYYTAGRLETLLRERGF